ncbi:MAG: YggT family protein [Ardenticatenaceae bacterium]|nr:YggT family protein [Ardenticatenaceae bacterium]
MIIFIQLINLVYYALVILIFARFIFSWVRVDPYHPTWGPIARFVYQATEPLLAPIRRYLPPQAGLDLSPMILLFGIYILRAILFSLL